MKNKIIQSGIGTRIGIFVSLCILMFSCEKADDFKNKLDGIPQISNDGSFKYRSTYAVGDTMLITGLLHPDKDLKIQIGDAYADILKLDTVNYYTNIGYTRLQRASLIITDKMGVGKVRPVVVSNGNNSVTGAPIEIYSNMGLGSFDTTLGFETILSNLGRQNVYFNCFNGKGEVYYYDFNNGTLNRVDSAKQTTVLMSASELTADQNGSFSIDQVLGGGVNPQGTMAYVSLRTPNDYRFCQIDFSTKTVRTLNQTSSSSIESPYEGDLGSLPVVFSTAYPDDGHTVYLLVGNAVLNYGANAMAVAEYDTQAGSLKYLLKTELANADMPGIKLFAADGTNDLRIYPQEHCLYYFYNQLNNIGSGRSIARYDLDSRIRINDIHTQNLGNNTYIGPFSGITIYMDNAWGFMPMSGYRLQTLYGGRNLPGSQWVVIDMKAERTYLNAPGAIVYGDYFIGPTVSGSTRVDQLLNYDYSGNLYLTAGNKALLVRTQAIAN